VQIKAITSHLIASYLGEVVDSHLIRTSFQVVVEGKKVSQVSSSPDETIPVPTAAPHKSCAPDPSPALLHLSRCPSGPQYPSCNKGPKTEHSIQGAASPVPSAVGRFPYDF